MKHTLRNLMVSVLALVGIALPFVYAAPVFAQTPQQAICEGVSIDQSGGSCTGNEAGGQVGRIIQIAIRIFQTIVGVISIFAIITAGLNYINSGGDSGKIKTAKDRILYAAIGLVVVALAQVIIQFVLNRVNESNPPAPTTGIILDVLIR